jgi:hypothetical protein
MTTIAPVNPAVTAAPSATVPSASRYGFGADGFTFGDLLDIINPLQHIPVVGTIYRAITGDTMEAGSEIAGGALYGGPVGALLSVADVAFTESTGKPIDETMLGWVGLDGSGPMPQVAMTQDASAQTAALTAAQTRAVARTPASPLRGLAPARLFPAATSRIVPLADYARLPAQAVSTSAAVTAAALPAQTVVPQPAPAATEGAAAVARGADLQGAQALLAALRDSGVDPASAARAAAAYQASLTRQAPVARPPAPSDSDPR